MNKVITLLNEKNHYLEKFYTLNEVELVNFAQGDFANLEYFYNSREQILEILKYIDAQIENSSYQFEMHDQSESSLVSMSVAGATELKKQIKVALDIKDEYVTRIIEQDIQVLSCIETAKNAIIRELQETRRNRKSIGGYKTQVYSNRLNEEV